MQGLLAAALSHTSYSHTPGLQEMMSQQLQVTCGIGSKNLLLVHNVLMCGLQATQICGSVLPD